MRSWLLLGWAVAVTAAAAACSGGSVTIGTGGAASSSSSSGANGANVAGGDGSESSDGDAAPCTNCDGGAPSNVDGGGDSQDAGTGNDAGAAAADSGTPADAGSAGADSGTTSSGCPGYMEWTVPAGECLYLNGGTYVPLDMSGNPICADEFPINPAATCATVTATTKPIVYYASDAGPNAIRALFPAPGGSCSQTCSPK